jgi:hypothetical protein
MVFLLFRYVTSIYFVTTTASTVGYGDYFGMNSHEKVFEIFLQFFGICLFSIITGNITSLKRKLRVKNIIKSMVRNNVEINLKLNALGG